MTREHRRQAGLREFICPLTLIILMVGSAVGQPRSTVSEVWSFEEARQFDFWIGEWSVNNRFVQDDGSWLDSGTAAVKIYRILDGKAILEYWDGEFSDGRVLHGFSLRYFDREKGKWQLALNWPGPNQPAFGTLEGSFRHGRGEFFSQWVDRGGQRVIQRYSFSDIGSDSVRWDDGVSTDSGKTWKSNWVMEFSRTAQTADWAPVGKKFHTYKKGKRCKGDQFEGFDKIEGAWDVSWGDGSGIQTPARVEVRRVLDGCAVMIMTEGRLSGQQFGLFQLVSFLPNNGHWILMSLDNQSGTGYEVESGNFENGVIALQSAQNPEQPLHRTRWTSLTKRQMAFVREISTDDGKTWRTVLTVQGQK